MSRVLWSLLLIVAACVAVFANTVSNGFHLDDVYRVLGNAGVEQFWPPWRHFVDPRTNSSLAHIVQYRPLLPLSLSISHALAGGHSAVAYHVGSILIHAAASCMLFLFARELLSHVDDGHSERLRPVPLLAALLFAVHPVSGVPVNYICSRDLLLMQMFLLATLWSHLRMRRRGRSTGRVAVCLVLFVLAVLAKKNALLAPVLVLLLEWLLPIRRRAGAAGALAAGIWRPALPYAVVGGAILVFIRFGLGFSDLANVVASPDWVGYGLGQLQHHCFHYLRNFGWPFSIHMGVAVEHSPWQQVVGGGCLLGSWWIAWRLRARDPVLVFCLLSYQVLLGLTSSVIPLHDEVVAYRPYPSAAFLFLGVASLCCRRLGPRGGPALLLAAVGYFAIASVLINPIWRTSESLWRHSLSHGGSVAAHANLAAALPDGAEKAALLYRAVEMDEQSIGANIALGAMLVDTGQAEQGLRYLRQAVAINPRLAQARAYLARGASIAGNRELAADEARQAARLDPGSREYAYLAGQLAALAKRHREAVQWFERAQTGAVGYRDAAFQAAVSLLQAGELGPGIERLRRFLRANPVHAYAWFNLGWAQAQQGRDRTAIEALHESLRHDSGIGSAHHWLATCYRRIGDAANAARHQRLFEQRPK